MPRKMFRAPEGAAPQERPGAGSPDDSGVHKLPKAEEAKVMIDPEYAEELAAPRHKKLQGMVGELLEIEKERQGIERYTKREQLMAEAADIKQREKEMREEEGGSAYFVEEERLKEIEKELGISRKPEVSEEEQKAKELKRLKRNYAALERKQEGIAESLGEFGINSLSEIEAKLTELSPELREETSDLKPGLGYRLAQLGRRLIGRGLSEEAKKLLREYHDLDQRMSANAHDQEELRGTRFDTEAPEATRLMGRDLSSVESDMDNIRQSVGKTGMLPEQFDRLVAGFEKTKDKSIGRFVKAYQGLMKEEIELRKNLSVEVMPEASLRAVAVNARMYAEADEKARNERLAAKSVAHQQLESRALMERRKVWEAAADIEDAIKNLEGVKDEYDVLQDKAFYQTKQDEFAKRVRALESGGTGKEYDEALQAAEDALARYAVAINRRLTSYARSQEEGRKVFNQQVQEQARRSAAEMEAGRAMPQSVIGMREGTSGSYGTGSAGRRTVELSRMGKERESLPKGELVNKEVGMYRSEEWRKELIDRINADEQWRSFMHGVYEDVSGRMKELSAGGHDLGEAGSPDAALDYALALFRGHARRGADNGFIYTESDRKMAQEETKRLDGILGWGERYKVKEEERAEPLKAEKRSRSKKELEKIEEDVEPILTVEEVTPEEAAEMEATNAKVLANEAGLKRRAEENKAYVAGLKSKADVKLNEALKEARAKKKKPVIDEEALTAAEQEAEQGIPSLAELQAMAKSPDMQSQFPKHEDLIHMKAPDIKNPIVIEDKPRRPQQKKMTQEERMIRYDESKRLTKDEKDLVLQNLEYIANSRSGPMQEEEIMRLIANAPGVGWMDSYLSMYEDARALYPSPAREDIRERLEQVNKLLALRKAKDLLSKDIRDLYPEAPQAPSPLLKPLGENPKKRQGRKS